MSIRQEFKNRVSRSAFKVIDDELQIEGKFARVSKISSKIDVYLVKPGLQPIGSRKLTNICMAVSCALPDVKINRLTGEAWFQCDYLPTSLFKSLGIKKRRQLSDESKAKLRDRLAEMKK